MDKRTTGKKRSKAKRRVVAGTGLAALAIALGLGMNWGLGGSGGGAGSDSGEVENIPPTQQSENAPTETPSPSPEEGQGAAYQERLIEISEDNIYVEGELVPEEDLQDYLLRLHEQGAAWELRNNRGKKHAYDAAKEALQALSIPFFESEGEG